jgi:hypothetical protein
MAKGDKKVKAQEGGFEYDAEFFPWHITDKVKDLQLIDHFAEIPPQDFFQAVQDDFDRSRTPILAAMMATSVRHAKPEWSRSKVIRFIEDVSMSDVEFFEGEDDEDKADKEGDEKLVPLDSLPSGEDEGTPDSSKK